MLDTLSAENYRDEHSEIIQYLNNLGADILVGIERKDGIYTLIGTENDLLHAPFNGTRKTPH
ncbi:Uncharacterised protein [Sphingobacterium multivorum]|uniref:Uncharacterized protein n=2 Tax=Sphingobacteriaceae TaxID=84566 RepID=A0A2X2IWF8_SPHMU|nr:Uncharacterised protein [Sphingobacterium multivorum]